MTPEEHLARYIDPKAFAFGLGFHQEARRRKALRKAGAIVKMIKATFNHERRTTLLEAAAYVDFYGDERLSLCGDAILFDPILGGEPITPENWARSRDLQIDSTINSAAYHAAQAIAAHLREMAEAT